MEPWPLIRSLFDNHESADIEANLAYMYKHFGFYLPDAEFLIDAEGLLRYLVSSVARRGLSIMDGLIPNKRAGVNQTVSMHRVTQLRAPHHRFLCCGAVVHSLAYTAAHSVAKMCLFGNDAVWASSLPQSAGGVVCNLQHSLLICCCSAKREAVSL